MQESTRFDLPDLNHNITASASGRGGNNILVEGERNKNHQQQQIYNCTDGPHGLWSNVDSQQSALPLSEGVYPYISGLFGLLISLPFNPAFRNTGASHRTKLNVIANAIPLRAMETTKGAPSP